MRQKTPPLKEFSDSSSVCSTNDPESTSESESSDMESIESDIPKTRPRTRAAVRGAPKPDTSNQEEEERSERTERLQAAMAIYKTGTMRDAGEKNPFQPYLRRNHASLRNRCWTSPSEDDYLYSIDEPHNMLRAKPYYPADNRSFQEKAKNLRKLIEVLKDKEKVQKQVNHVLNSKEYCFSLATIIRFQQNGVSALDFDVKYRNWKRFWALNSQPLENSTRNQCKRTPSYTPSPGKDEKSHLIVTLSFNGIAFALAPNELKSIVRAYTVMEIDGEFGVPEKLPSATIRELVVGSPALRPRLIDLPAMDQISEKEYKIHLVLKVGLEKYIQADNAMADVSLNSDKSDEDALFPVCFVGYECIFDRRAGGYREGNIEVVVVDNLGINWEKDIELIPTLKDIYKIRNDQYPSVHVTVVKEHFVARSCTMESSPPAQPPPIKMEVKSEITESPVKRNRDSVLSESSSEKTETSSSDDTTLRVVRRSARKKNHQLTLDDFEDVVKIEVDSEASSVSIKPKKKKKRNIPTSIRYSPEPQTKKRKCATIARDKIMMVSHYMKQDSTSPHKVLEVEKVEEFDPDDDYDINQVASVTSSTRSSSVVSSSMVSASTATTRSADEDVHFLLKDSDPLNQFLGLWNGKTYKNPDFVVKKSLSFMNVRTLEEDHGVLAKMQTLLSSSFPDKIQYNTYTCYLSEATDQLKRDLRLQQSKGKKHVIHPMNSAVEADVDKCIICRASFPNFYTLLLHYKLNYPRLAFTLKTKYRRRSEFLNEPVTIDICLQDDYRDECVIRSVTECPKPLSTTDRRARDFLLNRKRTHLIRAKCKMDNTLFAPSIKPRTFKSDIIMTTSYIGSEFGPAFGENRRWSAEKWYLELVLARLFDYIDIDKSTVTYMAMWNYFLFRVNERYFHNRYYSVKLFLLVSKTKLKELRMFKQVVAHLKLMREECHINFKEEEELMMFYFGGRDEFFLKPLEVEDSFLYKEFLKEAIENYEGRGEDGGPRGEIHPLDMSPEKQRELVNETYDFMGNDSVYRRMKINPCVPIFQVTTPPLFIFPNQWVIDFGKNFDEDADTSSDEMKHAIHVMNDVIETVEFNCKA